MGERILRAKTTGQQGFTLIELVVTMLIVAILAAIAIPAYTDYTMRARRAEAKTALLRLQNEQEKYYLNNNKYATDVVDILGTATTENGLYTIAINAPDAAAGYTATATATGIQASDTDCATISVSSTGERTAATSGGTANNEECWR